MTYELPVALNVCGTEYCIRSDYRAVLDVCAALTDMELSDNDRGVAVLGIFYPAFEQMPPEHYSEAIKKCFWFINCGAEETKTPAPKLMDWEQDFPYIVAPINRILGKEIRSVPYLHWWTFISFYYEIGDCLFAQIVRIRDLKRRGKTLDKQDREWYSKNRDLVDLKVTYTEAEKKLLKDWGF